MAKRKASFAGKRPASARNRVVFPEPEGPSRHVVSPAANGRVRSARMSSGKAMRSTASVTAGAAVDKALSFRRDWESRPLRVLHPLRPAGIAISIIKSAFSKNRRHSRPLPDGRSGIFSGVDT